MKRLGVNIDHVATLRNARGESHPSILLAAKLAIKYGANLITIHLREDSRHIKKKDLINLSKLNSIPINLEIAANNKMLNIALKYNPDAVCLVPEKRKEITTEGGLDLKKNTIKLKKIISKLNKKKIKTSLFINPSLNDIKISKYINTNCVELHTGKISRQVKKNKSYKKELNNIVKCSKYASSLGIEVHAGHGLDYKTAAILSKIKEIEEYNIGHFIIGESIFFGLKKTISKFKKICK